jgi:Zn-dependent protease
MLLLEPNETAWDLRWRMFGIPVRIHPMFWLMAAVLGGDLLKAGVQYLLAWIGCVFVSILVHELGHILMGLAFGAHGHIVLYAFGGLAVGSNQLDSRWQRVAVCFAGPLAGFLLAAGVFAGACLRDPDDIPGYVQLLKADVGIAPTTPEEFQALASLLMRRGRMEHFVVSVLMLINLLWGLLNLLPVWPLDGGQISRDLCLGAWPGNGLSVSLGISLVTAGVLALQSVMAMTGRSFLPFVGGSWYRAIFFGMLAIQSFQLLQQADAERRERAEWTDRHWEE